MSPLTSCSLFTIATLLTAVNARLILPYCATRDWGDVSEGKHLLLPKFVVPYGSSGRVDIPDYCEAKGLGGSCGRQRVEACNANRDGAKPTILDGGVSGSTSPVWVKCNARDGCYPGGITVYVTLYCTEVCM